MSTFLSVNKHSLYSIKKINKSRKMVKDEGWIMKEEGYKLLMGFGDRLTNGRTFVNVE